jgi:hypothetical protein
MAIACSVPRFGTPPTADYSSPEILKQIASKVSVREKMKEVDSVPGTTAGAVGSGFAAAGAPLPDLAFEKGGTTWSNLFESPLEGST